MLTVIITIDQAAAGARREGEKEEGKGGEGEAAEGSELRPRARTEAQGGGGADEQARGTHAHNAQEPVEQ
jgi:hypothetical protein